MMYLYRQNIDFVHIIHCCNHLPLLKKASEAINPILRRAWSATLLLNTIRTEHYLVYYINLQQLSSKEKTSKEYNKLYIMSDISKQCSIMKQTRFSYISHFICRITKSCFTKHWTHHRFHQNHYQQLFECVTSSP